MQKVKISCLNYDDEENWKFRVQIGRSFVDLNPGEALTFASQIKQVVGGEYKEIITNFGVDENGLN